MLQAGASKLSFFAVGWTGKTGQLTVVIENGGTFEGGATSKVIALDGKRLVLQIILHLQLLRQIQTSISMQ